MTSHLFLVLACVTCASVSAHTLPSPQQPSLSDSSQDQLDTLLYQLQTALENEEEMERAQMQWQLCGEIMQFNFRRQYEVQCCIVPRRLCLIGVPEDYCPRNIAIDKRDCRHVTSRGIESFFLANMEICVFVDEDDEVVRPPCYRGTVLRPCNTAKSMASSPRRLGYYY